MPKLAVTYRLASRFASSPVASAMPLDFDAAAHVTAPAALAHGGAADGITYRAFTSADDAAACVALQREIWGSDFDLVPASLLRVVTSIGGLAAGAFADDGTLLGFVFGLAGVRDGELIHWSHMLGVRESARGIGVGRHLKEIQRAELARRGVGRVMWTFDPLQARNAHLNFNRLGARVVDYVENMYGITASPLHHGIPTDRLVVELPTDETTPTRWHAHLGVSADRYPILTPFPRSGDPLADPDSDAPPGLRIEIPSDLQEVVAHTPAIAAAWRLATRAHFRRALLGGYEMAGVHRDRAADRAFYVLVHPSEARDRAIPRPSAR